MPSTLQLPLSRDRLFVAGGASWLEEVASSNSASAVAGVVAARGSWNEPDHRQQLNKVLLRCQWRLLGVEMTADVRGDEDSTSILMALQSLPDQTLVLLQLVSHDPHDKPSAPRALPAAATVVTALARAAPHLTFVLDHRAGVWLARIEDAVRLLMRVYCPNVGVALNLTDWQATDGDMDRLGDIVRLALPKLRAISIDISSTPPDELREGAAPPLLLDALRYLQLAGYTGPVMLRCQ